MTPRRNSFTLIELLVVISIVGIITAIAIPRFQDAIVRAKLTCVLAEMTTIGTSIDMYRADIGMYPASHFNFHSISDEKHNGLSDFPNQMRYYFLTTPIPYLTMISEDPFLPEEERNYDMTPIAGDHFYGNTWGFAYDFYSMEVGSMRLFGNHYAMAWGHWWRLYSWGPNKRNDYLGTGLKTGNPSPLMCRDGVLMYQYQISNGLRSDGNIIRVGPRYDGRDNGNPQINYYCFINNSV